VVSFAAVAKRLRYSSRPARRAAPKRPSAAAQPGLREAEPAPTAASPTTPPESAGPFQPETGVDDLPRASAGHLTDTELRRAEELQAVLAAQERAALAESIRRKARTGGVTAFGDDVNAPLKVRAAHEYAYVARDVRRIILTGGLMLGILAVLAVLINVAGVVSI
jgi:hypothetical protein